MKNKTVKILSLFLAFVILAVYACGCTKNTSEDFSYSSTDEYIVSEEILTDDNSSTTTEESSSAPTNSSEKSTSSTSKPSSSSSKPTVAKPVSTKAFLNGVDIAKYTIVYGSTDYAYRAAEYICETIKSRVGVELEIVKDGGKPSAHEIIVGETDRQISKDLNPELENVNFAIMAKNGSVALEGKYFVIAAAAYYFTQNYITGKAFSNAVPTKATVCKPIVKKPKNFIYLIGDGMGVSQTKLFENRLSTSQVNDGENLFYGYMLPYAGFARTKSLDGVTDSAAAGTALATGYKTHNGYIGVDRKKQPLTSLTEIAGSLGMATAVMSTEGQTGATPAAFSAHAESRSLSDVIYASQQTLQKQYGTIIEGELQGYGYIPAIETELTNTLKILSKNKNGFFFMYEEAHIDKNSHSQNVQATFDCVIRFNQVIGVFMEFAFYNPETFLLITADHETGGMRYIASGKIHIYSHRNHSDQNVPVFAYGIGGEIFNGKTIENVQIPKTISAWWGKEIIDPDGTDYPALK